MSISSERQAPTADRGDAAAPHYSMVLTWDPRDAIYVVRVPELDGCVTHGATYEEAVRQGQDAIATWVEGARADGLPLPQPNSVKLADS